MRPVVRWGTEVMHRRARPVTSYDEELRGLVADMVATMYAADGVGLAACQIGVDLAVFVFDCPDESGTTHRGVVCNPVVELPEGRNAASTTARRAACPTRAPSWTAPGPTGPASPGRVVDGEDVSYEGDGLLARCLQHEADHIEGTVFGDRLNDRARKKLRKQMEAAAEDYPGEWPVGEDVEAPGARPRGRRGTDRSGDRGRGRRPLTRCVTAGATGCDGRSTVTVVPTPTLLSIATLPSIWSTSSRTLASPSPLPPSSSASRPRTNSSKIVSMSPGSMPAPLVADRDADQARPGPGEVDLHRGVRR